MTGKSDVILRRKAVEDMVGLSRTTIYDRMAEGTFPRAIQLGPRAVGWRLSAIEAFIDTLEETGKPKQATAAQ